MRSQTVKRQRPQAVKRNDVSPTAPSFVTLNDRLNQAHRRIRELEARGTELLAQNRALCAVITELTDDGHARKRRRPVLASAAHLGAWRWR